MSHIIFFFFPFFFFPLLKTSPQAEFMAGNTLASNTQIPILVDIVCLALNQEFFLTYDIHKGEESG